MKRIMCVCGSVSKRCKLGLYKIFTVPCPKDSSLLRKFSCPCVKGFPSNEGVEKGYSLRSSYITTLGLSSVKMVPDRHGHVAYHNKH